jgi:PhnB protein
MAVKAIPEGFHTITPYLIVKDASKFIDFAKQAFDAQEIHRTAQPDGTVMHAQLKIGDSMIMLGEAMGEWKPIPAALYLYVNDVDQVYKQAIKAGATSVMEVADQFYGDRHGGVKDAYGNQWWIATHIEDVSPDELERRSQAFMKDRGQKK